MGRRAIVTAGVSMFVIISVPLLVLFTDLGARLAVRMLLPIVNGRLNGSVTVGAARGAIVRALELDRVTLTDSLGTVVAFARRVRVEYRLRDLIAKRWVLQRVELVEPDIDLIPDGPGESPTLLRVFRPDPPSADPAATAVELRNVTIERGRVRVVRMATESSETPFTGQFSDLNGTFPLVRFAPDTDGVSTLSVSVGDLSGTVPDSAVVVRAAQGRIGLRGDSLTVAISEIGLGESSLALTGWVLFREGERRFELTLAATPLLTDEVRLFTPAIPPGIVGTGTVRVRVTPGSGFEVRAEQFELRTADESERVRGRVDVSVDAEGQWVQRATRIVFENVDVGRLQPFLADSLPVAGRVSGVVAADGPQTGFQLDVDGVFRDASVVGYPQSSLTGRGMVGLSDNLPRLSQFRVERASVDVGSLGRFAPTGTLRGVIRYGGTVNGSLDSAQVAGTLAHYDGPGPASVVHGSLRMDRRRGPLRVWADVDVDSVQQTTLRGINPALEVPGPLAGRVSLVGRLDSLGFNGRIVGPAAEIDGRGMLAIANGRVELDLADGGVRRLDLALVRDEFPSSNIYARVSGGGVLQPSAEREWRVRAALDSSTVLGVLIDSAWTALTGTDSLIDVDTVSVWGDHVRVAGSGTVALEAPHRGAYRVRFESDSVGAFEPWVARWLSDVSPDSGSPLSGMLSATVTGVGSLENQELTIEFEGRGLSRGGMFLSAVRGDGSWETSTKQFRVNAQADSALVGSFTMRNVQAEATGRPESFAWNGDVDFYSDATVGARGSVSNDDMTIVVVDSAFARLGLSRWVTDTAVRVMVEDSTIEVSELRLVNTAGPGRVTLSGRMPTRVPGTVTASLQGVSIADVLAPLGAEFSGVEGDLEGTGRFTGTAEQPSFTLDFSLRDGAFKTFRTSLVEGRFQYDSRQLDGTFTVQSQGRRLITVSGQAPLDLALQAVEERRVPGRLEIRGIADSLTLDMLEPFMAGTASSLEGTVVADVTVRGTWEQPELGGQLTLTEGAATVSALGLRHRNAEAQLALSGNTIRINRATLTSGSGTVTVTGSATVSDLMNPDLDLRLQARDFRLIDRPGVLTLTTSADVTLRGPMSGATLSGRGVANRGDLYATDLLEKQVVNLADTVFAAYVDTTVLRAEGTGSLAALPFVRELVIDTLRFRLGSDVWMRSSEADVQLVGDVSVIKRGEEYRLNGTLTATRGFYRLQLGPAVKRDFVVTRGEIRFLGTPDLNADLDIETQHQIRTARGSAMMVNAHLGGTVYQPRLTLTSDVQPPLSETEIVSYLLFGAPSAQAFGDAGGNQGRFVFEQSVDRFASVLAGELERSLINGLGVPLDYLQIRPGEVSRGFSGTEIALGKQLYVLGRPVFLVASPRLCTDQLVSTRNLGASLEFRVTRMWLIAASVDPLRACEASTTQSLTRYQLGGDVFWERHR